MEGWISVIAKILYVFLTEWNYSLYSFILHCPVYSKVWISWVQLTVTMTYANCWSQLKGIHFQQNPPLGKWRLNHHLGASAMQQHGMLNSLITLTLIHTVRICVSHSGYHGLYCEEEYNECLSAPCQNYATCRDLINAYECVCTPQFEGMHAYMSAWSFLDAGTRL